MRYKLFLQASLNQEATVIHTGKLLLILLAAEP